MSCLDECCPLKDVGGKLYTFSHHISEDERDRFNCSSKCAYEQEETAKERKFCFKPGTLESECKTGNIYPGYPKVIKIDNELNEEVSGMINFGQGVNPATIPYTIDANEVYHTRNGPGVNIVNVTATTNSGIACEPYIHAAGGEPNWKFIIRKNETGGCQVFPARKLISIECGQYESGMIHFKEIQPLPFTCDENNNFTFNSTYVPGGTIITNITATYCFGYHGEVEQNLGFGMMRGVGTCYIEHCGDNCANCC